VIGTATCVRKELIGWGAGPRACQQWILGGKVRRGPAGRFHVTLDDAVALAVPVLRHRIVPTFTPRPKASRGRDHPEDPGRHAAGDAKKIL